MMSDPMIPIGRSRPGFRTSSAAVDTASNPMYAKKTIAAPVTTPVHPNGRNGVQFAGLMYRIPMKMKNMTIETLTATIAELNLALPLKPVTSRSVIKPMMRMAGMLMSPPSVPGGLENAAGRVSPTPLRKLSMYPDHPIATTEIASEYSRIRSQPIIHAQISPGEA